MSSDKKFTLLRKLLRTIGLSQQASDDVVNAIHDMLAGEARVNAAPQLPYRLNERFLTPAELNFFQVLQAAVNGRAVLCTKVNLGDLFRVAASDQSEYRIYTNKIDRKHVDFLLCDLTTLRPLVGIELDDKSHQRADRQARDVFVNEVFKAARLPLLRVPVKASYRVADLEAKLVPLLAYTPPVQPVALAPEPPCCPSCGSDMVLRTARKGSNAGQQFWGCSQYPTCRAMLPYEQQPTR